MTQPDNHDVDAVERAAAEAEMAERQRQIEKDEIWRGVRPDPRRAAGMMPSLPRARHARRSRP